MLYTTPNEIAHHWIHHANPSYPPPPPPKKKKSIPLIAVHASSIVQCFASSSSVTHSVAPFTPVRSFPLFPRRTQSKSPQPGPRFLRPFFSKGFLVVGLGGTARVTVRSLLGKLPLLLDDNGLQGGVLTEARECIAMVVGLLVGLANSLTWISRSFYIFRNPKRRTTHFHRMTRV